MKLTKNLVSHEDALQVSESYVKFAQDRDFSMFQEINAEFQNLKRGQEVITYLSGQNQFVKAKVTQINHNSWQAIDGPVVRVSNGEYSWRVDGDAYAYPA